MLGSEGTQYCWQQGAPVNHSMAGEIDFNEWMDLAHRDPAAFEARRREVVDELIDQSPKDRRERLRGLQWRIDKVRERSASPMAGCLSLYGMMWDSLAGSGGLVEQLNHFRGHPRRQRERRRAAIVPFPSRTRDC